MLAQVQVKTEAHEFGSKSWLVMSRKKAGHSILYGISHANGFNAHNRKSCTHAFDHRKGMNLGNRSCYKNIAHGKVCG